MKKNVKGFFMQSGSVASLLSVVSDGCLPHPVYGAVHLVTTTFVQPKLNFRKQSNLLFLWPKYEGNKFPRKDSDLLIWGNLLNFAPAPLLCKPFICTALSLLQRTREHFCEICQVIVNK